tara:strand:+ start:300 stop:527 length:228 start_codon:yes stop_codon:yes gene_type:complete
LSFVFLQVFIAFATAPRFVEPCSADQPTSAFIIHEVVKERPTTGGVLCFSDNLSATHFIAQLQGLPKGRVFDEVV